MNALRIQEAARNISVRETALKWLLEYGTQFTGRETDSASVHVHINFASACPGAKEATEILNSYAKLDLPRIVQSAISCCRNDIEIWREVIRTELDRQDPEPRP